MAHNEPSNQRHELAIKNFFKIDHLQSRKRLVGDGWKLLSEFSMKLNHGLGLIKLKTKTQEFGSNINMTLKISAGKSLWCQKSRALF